MRVLRLARRSGQRHHRERLRILHVQARGESAQPFIGAQLRELLIEPCGLCLQYRALALRFHVRIIQTCQPCIQFEIQHEAAQNQRERGDELHERAVFGAFLTRNTPLRCVPRRANARPAVLTRCRSTLSLPKGRLHAR